MSHYPGHGRAVSAVDYCRRLYMGGRGAVRKRDLGSRISAHLLDLQNLELQKTKMPVAQTKPAVKPNKPNLELLVLSDPHIPEDGKKKAIRNYLTRQTSR